MKILCIANDIPLPANSGGRVDVWRRLCALKAAGHSVALVCWLDVGRVAPPTDALLAELNAVCDAVKILAIMRSPGEILRRLLQLWRWPSHVAARMVTAQGIESWVREFAPDVVWLDGLYGGALACALSDSLGRPLWYRSHNIEHRYMAAQRVRETRLVRRLGLLATCFGLERFERKIMQRAARVLDISPEDASFWTTQGVGHIQWLPPLVDDGFAQRLSRAQGPAEWDLLYFGNLNTPNNVEALTWLVNEVLPHVAAGVRIAVAGSRPSDPLRSLVTQDSRIELIENPEDMASVVSRAKVLVNPMKAGSGVNLKSVEMLFTNAVLVSTSVGVAGLPPAAKACFVVADNPLAFAAAISAGLGAPVGTEERTQVRLAFSPSALTEVFGRPGEVLPC